MIDPHGIHQIINDKNYQEPQMTDKEKLDFLLNQVLLPLVGDLNISGALSEHKRDILRSKLKYLSEQNNEPQSNPNPPPSSSSPGTSIGT